MLASEDPKRARELLEEAVAGANWQVLPVAQANLAGLLIRDDPARARELLEAVVASTHSQVLAMAQANLGGLLRIEDPERARALLAEAAATPGMAAHASALLGALEGEAGNPVAAAAAFERAIALGDVCWSNVARLDFAAVLVSSDHGRARELLEEALASSDKRVLPSAQVSLAVDLMAEDPVRARELLESALVSGDVQVTPLAQANLGGLLVHEDPVRARELLEASLASGNAAVAPLAQANLGGLLMHEDPARARELLEASLASGDPRVLPLAATNLGGLLLGEDPVRAQELLEAAVRTGDARLVPVAQANLAAVLMGTDPVRAKELLEDALASGNVQVRQPVQVNLGVLLIVADPARARELLEPALATASGPILALARISFSALVQGEDADRARELLEAVIESGIGAAQAGDLLGDLERSAGDRTAAAAAYEGAIALGDAYWSEIARLDLAMLLADDDPARTRELLEAVIESGIGAAQAWDLLGDLEKSAGDRTAAAAAYEGAIALGDAYWSEIARLDLAMLLVDDDRPRTRELLSAVIESGVGAAQASYLLADLEKDAGDAAAAEAAYEGAIALADPYWSELARLNLAVLIGDTDAGRARELLETAVSSGEPMVAPVAQTVLDELLREEPDH